MKWLTTLMAVSVTHLSHHFSFSHIFIVFNDYWYIPTPIKVWTSEGRPLRKNETNGPLKGVNIKSKSNDEIVFSFKNDLGD